MFEAPSLDLHPLEQGDGPTHIDRFPIRGRLGQGGWGVVYRAFDPETDREVALKVIPVRGPGQRARVEREVLALRALDDPGVVRLYGNGQADAGLWIAMELVEGRPFPQGGWSAIGGTALALAETLARMHALELIHRDLKPGNVLVRRDGRPVVLDLGLVGGEGVGAELTQEGALIGTPAYLAPEQLQGQRVDDRADIYALGVMLYEALAGRLPHGSADLLALQAARATESPTPLEALAPEAPPAVVDLIRRMLERYPEDRPRAEEVVRALTGRAVWGRPRRPRLDGDGLVEALLARLRSGEVMDIWGPRRSGRTRLLDDLEARSTGATRCLPGERPYSSLLPLLGPLDVHDPEEAHRRARAGLASASGPLLVDDWARIDPWSQTALLEGSPPAGMIRVREAPDAVSLRPLAHEALAGLFGGSERVLHLPSDAADQILRRTEGWPGRVSDLLDRWERQGVVEHQGTQLLITRDRLDLLIEETVESPPSDRTIRGLPSEHEDLLIAVRTAWPAARAETLAAALHRPAWEVRLQLELLQGRGLVRWAGPSLWACAETGARWAAERAQAAHAAIAHALPVGAEGRLAHVLGARDASGALQELQALVQRRIARGQAARAIALLWRLRELSPDDTSVVHLLVRLLVEQRSVDAIEQARFAVGADRGDLRWLIEAHRRSLAGDLDGVRELLSAAPVWSDPELWMLAFAAQVEAARGAPLAQMEALLEGLRTDPVVMGSLDRSAHWLGWLGILRFRQGRYAEAADLHEQAATGRSALHQRLSSRLNAVRAWIEADDLERAGALVRAVAQEAERTRLPSLEGQALWLGRVIARRAGDLCPDVDLLDSLAQLGDAGLLAQATMNEAYVAWGSARTGDQTPHARALATRAARAARAANMSLLIWHADALVWSLSPEGPVAPLMDRVLQSPDPRLVLDGLGVLAHARQTLPLPRSQWERLISAQPEGGSPRPYGALTAAEARRLVEPLLEPA